MSPGFELSVVICSLNGAPGVDRCLRALDRQVGAPPLDVVVVDDGSTDDTSEVARRHGARVVRHETNRGLSAARNSGVEAAQAAIVAFLDDDCEPAPDWAAYLLSAYEDDVVGVGGIVRPLSQPGFVGRYLERHNPLEPLEIELKRSEALHYRIRLYLARQWAARSRHTGRRPVYALVGANMSFRRRALLDIGLFDTRFTFGAEELDLCWRIALANPDQRFMLEPRARVVHHFEDSLRDTLRRSRAYGRGSARMCRKWPSARPTLFPFPVITAALLALATRWRPALALAFLGPHLAFPAGARRAVAGRGLDSLLDPYVQLAQESAGDAGFIEGMWRFRELEPERGHEAPTTDAVLERAA
jgi:cellulose synthase/poly-beta-1,6-N-acetylglucosamine synthase-like glycosyltransferase